MSSDQQLNVHISVVNDLCQNKHTCSGGDVISANVMLENEMNANCNATNDLNGQNLKVIEENVPTLEEVTGKSGIIQSHEKCPLEDNSHLKNDPHSSENGHENTPSVLIEEVTTKPVNESKFLKVDSQIISETALQSINPCLLNDPPPKDSNEQIVESCTEKEDEQSCVQRNCNESTDGVPDAESHTNENHVEFTNGSNADDDEFEDNDDDVSNEGDDNSSNERDSNEDCSDVEHSDGTTEVENDEYILDTVLRKPRKERRRIVSVNDDSDPEFDEERERLLQSPTIDENQSTDIVDDEDIGQLLIENDKPGPKSKKFSTQKLKELQARELLRNAVVIPSTSKKKKSRVIDSEDEEEPLPYSVDVDDIGLPDTTEDNENEMDGDALLGSSILLNDLNDFDKPDVLLTENSIPNCSSDDNNFDENIIKSELKDDNTSVVAQSPPDVKCSSENSREEENRPSDDVPSVKEESCEVTENETGVLCDSGNSTDSANQQNRKEIEIASANTDFPPFSSSSSDTEDEFIPNEIYFGTPDNNKKRSSRGKAQRPRGRPVQSSTREVKAVSNVVRSTKSGRNGGRSSRRGNFIDDRRLTSTSASSSDSDDEYRKSKARRKPATITIVKHPSQLYHKASLPVRPVQKQQQVQQMQRQNDQKRDRFYDKSRDIPNAVYFGDVDVPLHVLYSYDDSDSDNGKRDTSNTNRLLVQAPRGRPGTSGQLHRNQSTVKQSSNSPKAVGRTKAKAVSSLSPSSDRSIQMMKKYLKAAGLKKVKLNRLWEGCKSNSERADKMLELLREKGLEGEPTIAKCKQLKVDYLTRKEIEDLDPNLIIQTEGRTTRRSARAATKRQYTYDEDEILETRTKLKKVIDSDSDFE